MREKRDGLRTEATGICGRENFIDFSVVSDTDIGLVEFLIAQINKFGHLRHNLIVLLSQDKKFDYMIYEKGLTTPIFASFCDKKTGKWFLKTSRFIQNYGYPPEIRQE